MAKSIEYKCKLFADPITYCLVQLLPNQDFQLFFGNILIGTFANVGNKCIQTGGRQVSDRMLHDIYVLLAKL